jgi:hypothetical protein
MLLVQVGVLGSPVQFRLLILSVPKKMLRVALRRREIAQSSIHFCRGTTCSNQGVCRRELVLAESNRGIYFQEFRQDPGLRVAAEIRTSLNLRFEVN